jgi:hypothetical protein
MLAIRNLELHVTHACNLACESCSHYSNQGHKGSLALGEAERWMSLWSARLAPEFFHLLGGEPTIHPDLSAFLPLVRRAWPRARIRIVTNGFFLDRHPALPEAMRAAGNCFIAVSIHHDGTDYRARFAPIWDLLGRWVGAHGIEVHFLPSHLWWTRRYRGSGAAMAPYDDRRPRKSWEICPAKYCPQLHDAKIWKCAPLAYLGLQHAKYGLDERWRRYLDYRPLSPGCSDAELAEFFAREEEPSCAMCPAAREPFKMPDPMLRPEPAGA